MVSAKSKRPVKITTKRNEKERLSVKEANVKLADKEQKRKVYEEGNH